MTSPAPEGPKTPAAIPVTYRRFFNKDDVVHEPDGIRIAEIAAQYLATLGGVFWPDPETRRTAVVIQFLSEEWAKRILGSELERLKAEMAKHSVLSERRGTAMIQLQECERMLLSLESNDGGFEPSACLAVALAMIRKTPLPERPVIYISTP